MEIKMKPQEIVKSLEGLLKVIESEEKYCEQNAKSKFTAKVSIAIAKSRKKLEEEFNVLQEQQRKNQTIAEKTGKKIKDVPEQIDLLKTEFAIEIQTISESDLLEGKDLSSSDFYNLLFMTK